jgi:hypothetical protein
MSGHRTVFPVSCKDLKPPCPCSEAVFLKNSDAKSYHLNKKLGNDDAFDELALSLAHIFIIHSDNPIVLEKAMQKSARLAEEKLESGRKEIQAIIATERNALALASSEVDEDCLVENSILKVMLKEVLTNVLYPLMGLCQEKDERDTRENNKSVEALTKFAVTHNIEREKQKQAFAVQADAIPSAIALDELSWAFKDTASRFLHTNTLSAEDIKYVGLDAEHATTLEAIDSAITLLRYRKMVFKYQTTHGDYRPTDDSYDTYVLVVEGALERIEREKKNRGAKKRAFEQSQDVKV